MDADAILGAVRGVLLGDLGSVRTIPADTFNEGVPAELVNDQARRNSVVEQTPAFDVEITPPRRTRAVGPSMASRAVLSIEVTVRLTYAITKVADVEGSTHRRAVRAQAAEHALLVTQALTWNRNLEDDGTDPTNLINGSLIERSSRQVREDWEAGVLEVECVFEGLVLETQAVA